MRARENHGENELRKGNGTKIACRQRMYYRSPGLFVLYWATMNKFSRFILLAIVAFLCCRVATVEADTTAMITIDATADRHAIDPRIYGLAAASEAQLTELNAPLNRWGGNTSSRYNWKLDCDNRGADWFFQSVASSKTLVAGAGADGFIGATVKGGGTPMMTVPMLDWVAKIGEDRGQKLWSFSKAKYGDQQKYDQWNHDSGNGLKADGKTPIAGNDPADANVPNSPEFQREWLKHLTGKWGAAKAGGRYYILDNEPALWNSTHRDVHPRPASMDEVAGKMVAYASMIKGADAKGLVVGPEEWGWPAYFYSAADSAWRAKNGYKQNSPERMAHGGADYVPYLLAEMKKAGEKKGVRLLDVLSIHYYPQGGEYGNNNSAAMAARRNRSTRSLWDANYKDETWINDKINLIPRLKKWAAAYPGTLIGITEYNWGAEGAMNGATAQADVLGIFGREGLDVANRWTTPQVNSPAFLAMKMYRNYDGKKSGFGDVSVKAGVEQPDKLAAFAAERTSDHALTVMVINKVSEQTAVTLAVNHFEYGLMAQVWQLSKDSIVQLPEAAVGNGKVELNVPGPSVTLVVLHGK